jgi:hypothetical protein
MQSRLFTGAFAVATLVLAACGTNEPAGISSETVLNADLATIAADAAAQDMELMRGPGEGPFAMGLQFHPGSFGCTREARSLLALERTCTFKDASGATQPAYDPLTTASVSVHAELSIEIKRGPWSGSVERVRDLTVSGLVGSETEMTWNGTGSSETKRVTVTGEGEERRYELTSATTINSVVIPVPRTATSWPKSGSISSTVHVLQPNGTERERVVSVVFNGTNLVQVTVNGESFQFDLSQRGRARRNH